MLFSFAIRTILESGFSEFYDLNLGNLTNALTLQIKEVVLTSVSAVV